MLWSAVTLLKAAGSNPHALMATHGSVVEGFGLLMVLWLPMPPHRPHDPKCVVLAGERVLRFVHVLAVLVACFERFLSVLRVMRVLLFRLDC